MQGEMASQRASQDVYPLRTVAAQTGLSADVIRAWEKRYRVVTPVRGPRGARLYDAGDIVRLRLLARVVAEGRAIGDVARLDGRELERLAGVRHEAGRDGPHDVVAAALEAVRGFDAERLERLLGDALVGLGSTAFVRRVAAPLVVEVGERWENGALSIADEHLMSATLRGLLIALMQRRRAPGHPAVLLGTLGGERHEMGLMLVALLALDAGLALSYLGVDLPAAEIVTAARRTGAAIVGISVVNGENRAAAVDGVRRTERTLPPGVALWLGGREARAVVGEVGAFKGLVMDDLGDVQDELARVRGAAAR
jgi:DNA-binding transcriptional MerR regulator